MTHSEIGIVIVIMHPSPEDIAHASALAAKYKGAIVDNSSCRNFDESQIGNMAYIPLLENCGIATAQNTAVRHLMKDSSIRYIVFLDQDSRIPDSYPTDMVKEYQRVKSQHPNLAILGPTVINKTTGEVYQSALHRQPEATNDFIVSETVISSGSCVETETLRAIGLNDERLFIDYVDFEWCWRATAQGYCCGQTTRVLLKHQVGRRALHLGRHIILVAAPFRYYYLYRNFLWLLRRDYVPRTWKRNNAVKLFLRLFYFPFVIPQGFCAMKNMWRGIFAGIKSPR